MQSAGTFGLPALRSLNEVRLAARFRVFIPRDGRLRYVDMIAKA
jgi:hypothetical protein